MSSSYEGRSSSSQWITQTGNQQQKLYEAPDTSRAQCLRRITFPPSQAVASTKTVLCDFGSLQLRYVCAWPAVLPSKSMKPKLRTAFRLTQIHQNWHSRRVRLILHNKMSWKKTTIPMRFVAAFPLIGIWMLHCCFSFFGDSLTSWREGDDCKLEIYPGLLAPPSASVT